VGAVLAVAIGAMLVLAPAAGAHTGDQSYVYLDVTESELAGRVEFPYADVRTVFGLELADDPEVALAEVLANEADLERYADDHFDIGTQGEFWPLTFGTPELLEGDQVWEKYVILPFEVDLGGPAPPRRYDVRFDPFFDEIDGRDALLLVGNDWDGGVIENGDDWLVGFDGNSRERSIDLGATSRWSTLWASTKLGLDHIRTGPDHIAFVFVLLLPSVLVYTAARRSWDAGRGFGSSLWRVLKIATMFTVAHSITFTLAGLELIPLPSSKLVESMIALSIAGAALHNLRPVVPNREWALAFGFGLFHGLGFASLVSGLDVSRSTQLISLLGRNLGIELGQVVVILMTFPFLYLLRRTRLYRPFFVAASLALAAVSVIWMIERIFERDLGIARWVDMVVRFPRSLVLMALLTAAAGALHWWEGRNDRLRPTAAGDGAVIDLTEDDREPVASA
jgi:hypothetical protein